MKPFIKHVVITTLTLTVVLIAAFGMFVQLGVYNFAADVPHTAFVLSLLDRMRERSIETRSGSIKVPDLADKQRILQGAGNYNGMCVQCHRSPDMGETELSKGLYPSPPNLTKEPVEAAHAFWVIKHGVKASGMPAWGRSMDDDYIWNMTAFLQVLPKLDAASYQNMVAHSAGHTHGGGESLEAGESHHHGPEEVAHHLDHEEAPHVHAQAETPAGQGNAMHSHADGTQHKYPSKGGTQ